jgi:predicted Zn-dependent protease
MRRHASSSNVRGGSIRPGTPRPALLAAVELNASRPTEALAAARAASLLRPDNGSVRHLIAQALSRLGDHDGAAAARLHAIRLGFDDGGRSWLRLSNDHAERGDTTAALAALDAAAAHAEEEVVRAAAGEMRARLVASPDTAR